MSDYIPSEILIEILARLPVKSLLRFTSVCKSWYSLITKPNFIGIHLNRAIKRTQNNGMLLIRQYTNSDMKEHYLLWRDDEKLGDVYSEIAFPFKSKFGYFRIVGICNGVLCLSDDYFSEDNSVMLWNPSIRKTVSLPMPYKSQLPHMFVLGFGFHPTSHEYKVLRLVYEKEHLTSFRVPPKAQIYKQGAGSWRNLSTTPPPYCMVEFMWSQVFLNGAVHWVAYDPSVVGRFQNLIVLFNMAEEVFSEMTLPPALADQQSTCLSVTLFGDSLAVLHGGRRERESCCVWVMTDYGVAESWTKLYTVKIPEWLDRVLAFRKNGEILLSTKNGRLLSYDPRIKVVSHTGLLGSSYSYNISPYIESLVLLKGQHVAEGF